MAVTFGGWTSVSRKSVLPVYEELNGILFYPVQWEGQESSANIFYTGATPNQQAIPAVDYLLDQGVKRFALLGTDYVYPRTTNKILEAYLKSKGIAAKDIMVNYTPFGQSDWQSIVADVKKFGAAGNAAVVSTINGDANVPFYKELANQSIAPDQIPVIAFFGGRTRAFRHRHQAAGGAFGGVELFREHQHAGQRNLYPKLESLQRQQSRDQRPDGSHLYRLQYVVKAVEKAGSTEPDAVKKALIGVEVPNLTGGSAKMLANHMITKPVFIGEIQDNGQFDVVWQTQGEVAGEAWSPLLPESANLVADWADPVNCGAYDQAAKKCTAGVK